jgi:hypothetical protein
MAWSRVRSFVPFPDYPPAIRRVVYTTEAIESINHQLRKVTKTRRQFTTDEAAYKLLYLAICDIELRTTSRGGNKERSCCSADQTPSTGPKPSATQPSCSQADLPRPPRPTIEYRNEDHAYAANLTHLTAAGCSARQAQTRPALPFHPLALRCGNSRGSAPRPRHRSCG